MQKLLVFLFISITFMQCNTCIDCKPFAEEPYLKIRFYKAVDSSANVVIIDSINHVWAGNYTNFKDTANAYLLPLNMNEDVSNFIISYRDTSDLATFFTNTLLVNYERSFLKRTDNNILVQCNILETTSNFSNKTLVCKESETLICNSNEALYQIYR